MEEEKEIWKPVVGYEGFYEVSNLGNVRSYHFGKTKLLKPGINKKGYLCVILSINGVRKTTTVHRLVLQSFNPQKDAFRNHINHINENKKDNRIDNLEWVTAKENNNHGTRNIRSGMSNRKPVIQICKNGEIKKKWDSIKDTISEGFDDSSVAKCCKNKQKTHKGYIWKYN